ncbi:Nucleoid occlusion protein [Caulifigura coniformis]|uniref:Nucleoid occlusion protein n=1 Tax=Caulifigura coniformis TaxID=2527983 RepID=A0A517SHA3_9PLAN|nr:ParB/RepB/Spo0J family partition protein [Caulifigura coniformis]QDT55495.1 Nucleoid occlusion protein [Caulifigura coniformis]
MQIPVDQIVADEDFNCRQGITVLSVRDLAGSLDTVGQIQPVVVKPRDDGRFDLIAGFRRYFAATKILQWETIDAVVKEVDQHEAETLNLIENIERQDLDVLAEAKAIEKLFPASRYSSEDAARAVRKYAKWVQHRRTLLQLPEDIQKHFQAGLIPLSRVRAVLESDDRENTCAVLMGRKRRQPCKQLGKRSKREVSAMMNRLSLEFDVDPMGPVVAALSWAIGHCATDRFERIIKEKSPC